MLFDFENESSEEKIVKAVRNFFRENSEEREKHQDEPEEPRPQVREKWDCPRAYANH